MATNIVDEKFKQLQQAGRNCVDLLLEWIRESKIIDNSKAAEEKALRMFADIADQHNVELEKFREVIGRLAEQEQKSMDQITQMLAEGIPKLQKALSNAAAAFRETMNKE